MRFLTIVILGLLLPAAGCETEETLEERRTAHAWRRALEWGDSDYEQEQFASALVAYTEAIRLRPDVAKAYNSRSNVYIAQGDFDKAIADFTEATRLEPDYAEVYCARGGRLPTSRQH